MTKTMRDDTRCAFQRDRLSGWKNDVRNGHDVSRFYRVRITGTTDWLTAYNVTGRLGEPPPTRRRRDSSCLRSSGVPYSLHYCLGGETTEQKRSNATRSRLYSNHAPEHLSRFRLFPLPSPFFSLSRDDLKSRIQEQVVFCTIHPYDSPTKLWLRFRAATTWRPVLDFFDVRFIDCVTREILLIDHRRASMPTTIDKM